MEETSTLSVFAQLEDGQVDPFEPEEGLPYRQQNLIRRFFKQRGPSTAGRGAPSVNPLASIPSFFSRLGTDIDPATVVAPLKAPEAIAAAQVEALSMLQDFTAEVAPVLQANLRDKTRAFWFEDLVQFFAVPSDATDLKAARQFDENFAGAMAVAISAWIAHNGQGSLFNTDKDINALMGRDKDTAVYTAERRLLGKVGDRRNLVVNSLGQSVYEALALQQTGVPPSNIKGDLIAHLGGYALKVALDMGLLQEISVTVGTLQELAAARDDGGWFIGDDGGSPEATQSFIRAAGVYGKDEFKGRLILADGPRVIADALKGTQTLFADLFGLSHDRVFPTLAPVKFTQKKVKRGRMKVPGWLARRLNEANKIPFRLREDMWTLYNRLGRETMLAMAGSINPEDPDLPPMSVMQAESEEARTHGFNREFDLMEEFVGGVLVPDGQGNRPDFFIENEMWRPQRVGMVGAINPQSHKTHRHMLYMPDWETVIALDDAAAVAGLKLRILEGLGVKTDRQANTASLAGFDAHLAAVGAAPAVAALRKALFTETELSDAELAAIRQAGRAGGEAMHSFDALVALAQLEHAQATGETSVTTRLMGEVDGVTNGPMLAHLMLGGASSAQTLWPTLNRGGIYQSDQTDPAGNALKNFNLWRSLPGSRDLYENTAVALIKRIPEIIKQGPRENFETGERGPDPAVIFPVLERFTGPLSKGPNNAPTSAGRKLMKTPLTTMIFGSSGQTSVDNMFSGLLDAIYARISKVATDQDPAAFKRLTDDLATLGVDMPADLTLDKLLELEFSSADFAALHYHFNETMGRAIIGTLKSEFSAFRAARTELNETANLVFDVFNAALQAMTAEEIERVVDKIEVRDKAGNVKSTKAVHGLPRTHAGRVRHWLSPLMPVVATAMSNRSVSDSDPNAALDSGFYMAKSERALISDPSQQGDLIFNQPMPGRAYKGNVKGKMAKTAAAGKTSGAGMRVARFETSEVSPGVATVIMLMHGMDSAVMQRMMEIAQTRLKRVPHRLNIHDAGGSGVGGFQSTAQDLNQALWDVAMEFSPADSIADAMGRMVTGLGEMLEAGALPTSAVTNIRGALQKAGEDLFMRHKLELSEEKVIPFMLDRVKLNALKANTLKFQVLSTTGAFDQYALQDGQFEPSMADRTKAREEFETYNAQLQAVRKAGAKRWTPLLLTTEEQAGLASIAQLLASPKPYTGPLDRLAKISDEELLAREGAVDSVDEDSRDNAPGTGEPEGQSEDPGAGNGNEGKEGSTGVDAPPKKDADVDVDTLRNHSEVIDEATKARRADMHDAILLARLQVRVASKREPFLSVKDVLFDIGYQLDQPGYKDNPAHAHLRLLYDMLKTRLPGDLEIVWLTPDTPTSLLTEGRGNATLQPTSMAWYSASVNSLIGGGQERIYLRSPDFLHSAVRTETLIHEFVHAMTALAMRREQRQARENPRYQSEALDRVKRLEALREHVRKALTPRQLQDWALALDSLDEFIAYGLTRRDFMAVLQGIDATVLAAAQDQEGRAKGLTRQLISVMKVFIRAVTDLVFTKATPAQKAGAVNALSILVASSAVVIQQDTRNRNAGWDDPDDPGSTTVMPPDLPITLAATQIGNIVNDYTTVDLFDAIEDPTSGRFDPVFVQHQRGLLETLGQHLFGPYGSFKEDLMKDQPLGPVDTWLEALATNQAPYADTLGASQLDSTEQERLVVDQIHAVMVSALDNPQNQTTAAYRELARLYDEIYAQLRGPRAQSGGSQGEFLDRGASFYNGDWTQASPIDRMVATEKFDFVFKLDQDPAKRSTYLARFAALALGHRDVYRLVRSIDPTDVAGAPRVAKSFGERIQRLFERILDFFQRYSTGSRRNHPVTHQTQQLVQRLIRIEAKHRAAEIKRLTNGPGFLGTLGEKANDVLQDLGTALQEGTAGLLDTRFFKNNTFSGIRLVSSAGRLILRNQADLLVKAIQKVSNTRNRARRGVITALANEALGADEELQVLHRATKMLEKSRQDKIDVTSRQLLEAFDEGGAYLADDLDSQAAISQVLLRSGAHHLLDHFSMTEIAQLTRRTSDRKAAIAAAEADLARVAPAPYMSYFVEQANVLGYYKATGRVGGEMLMMNAYSIAALIGTGLPPTMVTAKQIADSTPILSRLITLYAIDYLSQNERNLAADVMDRENARNDPDNPGNGVEFSLLAQRAMEEESLNTLFGGNPTLMLHGFTPEIYNPNVDIRLGAPQDERVLGIEGYARIGNLVQDVNDPANPGSTTGLTLYAQRGIRMTPYLSGALSLKALGTRGTERYVGRHKKATQAREALTRLKQRSLARWMRPNLARWNAGQFQRSDLSKQGSRNFMAPILNEHGEITGYRYLMNDSTRDSVLERDNRFHVVLGNLAGSLFDRQTAPNQNVEVLKALKEDVDDPTDGYLVDPESYVLVGPNSQHAELRELWRLTPRHTQDEIKAMFGDEGLTLKRDAVDLIFGYRRFSLTDMFKKNGADRNLAEELLVGMTEFSVRHWARTIKGYTPDEADALMRRAITLIGKAERGWQDLVKEIKDIIVVKSIAVGTANVYSNISFLGMHGMNPPEIISSHREALAGITAYQDDENQRQRLQFMLDSGYQPFGPGGENEMRRQIIQLEDAIARNPVKPLIEAGLLPTIVEDVTLEDDPYSNRAGLVNYIQAKTERLPGLMKAGAEQIYMGRNTAQYQVLSRMTQLSDFVARYALFTHLMRADNPNPMPRAEALQRVSEAFINYDLPMHRGIQALDDFGILPFIKYGIRIQPVLVRLFKENPARVLSALALHHVFDLGAIVTDSGWWERLDRSPLEWGALRYPSVLEDLGTVQAADRVMGLLK